MPCDPAHPFLQNDLAVRWSLLTSEHVVPDITRALAHAKAAVEAIGAQGAEGLSYESTLGALEAALEPLGLAWNYVGHLDSVCNSPELRKAHNEMLPAVSEFYSRLYLDRALWNVIKTFAESPQGRALEGAHKRHCEEVCADFRENGADLPEDKRARLVEIETETAAVTQKFSENVLDATNAFECVIEDPARLAGLPEFAKAAALASAKEKDLCKDGKDRWRFTLQEPSLGPVLQYADDDGLRRALWDAANAVGREDPYANTGHVPRILALRHEKARLLGREHFPDHVLARRMARTGKQALGFIEAMHKRIAPFFQKECAELEHFRAEQTGGAVQHLEPWEVSYWAEKLRKARTNFDAESLRPYFEVRHVIAGLFEIAQELFGIEIASNESAEVWHPDVRAYDMRDAGTGDYLGLFYADWHPRAQKRSGAWMNPLRTGRPHSGIVCGNMTAPAADTPALLTHDEVTVVFHEFGHLLHHMLGNSPVKSLGGTNVAWDFVELPSQILENWCWEPEALARFARHYQTGAPIPPELLEKMIRAKNFRAASFAMRQLSFAKMDLEMHLHADTWGADVENKVKAAIQDYLAPLARPVPTLIYRFGHLFSGAVAYAAGYYSYKWAEALEADAFSRFKEEGVLNPLTGAAFRQTILSKGNLEPPEKLFRDFMGRDLDAAALLRRDGLA